MSSDLSGSDIDDLSTSGHVIVDKKTAAGRMAQDLGLVQMEDSEDVSEIDPSSMEASDEQPAQQPVRQPAQQPTYQPPKSQFQGPQQKKPFYKNIKSKAAGLFSKTRQSPKAGPSDRQTSAEYYDDEGDEPYKFEIDYDVEAEMMGKPIGVLRAFIHDNYAKIVSYDFLAEKVSRLLMRYGPKGIYVDAHGNPGNILNELKRVLELSQKKWAMFDIPMDQLGVLKGSQIAAKMISSKQRIYEVLEAAQKRANIAEQVSDAQHIDMLELAEQIEFLKAELDRARATIVELRGEDYGDEGPTDWEFIRDLKRELVLKDNLNSSLNESLVREIQEKRELLVQIDEAEKLRVKEQQIRLQELTELAKEQELNEGIKKAVAGRIKSLAANPEEAKKAVNDWVRAIKGVLEVNKEELNQLGDAVKIMDDAVAENQARVNELRLEEEILETDIETLEENIHAQKQKERFFSQSLNDIVFRVEALEKRFQEAAARADSQSEQFYSFATTDTPIPEGRSPFQKKTPKRVIIAQNPSLQRWPAVKKTPGAPTDLPFTPMLPIFEASDSSSYQSRRSPDDIRFIDESDGSPERMRIGSPEVSPRYQHDIDPFSFTSTPSGRISDPSRGGPSPFDLNISSPNLQIGADPMAMGTQTLSRPISRFAPEIAPLNPSTRTLSGVTNRINLGSSFNMQTINKDPSVPYSQVTRVDSLIPEAGPSRMVDSPLNIRHRAEVTPNQYATPFIAGTRFGYTDPTAIVRNQPPGFGLIGSNRVQKTVVLTSPKRQEPLLVDIDVDPKPLTETESGEHFICDISLNLQQRGSQRQQLPVYTYEEAPAITPSSARKYGLFTPRGIFKRKHFNVRRIHWSGDYHSPNLPWSPHNLPDVRSPISALTRSPYISDSSIPWERSPDSSRSDAMNRTYRALNQTFGKSISPVIKGPYYGMESPESDSSSSQGIRTPGLNRTYNASQSPVIKGPYYGMESPESDSPSSQSPVIKGPYYGMESPESDSPSPVIEGRSYEMESPEYIPSPKGPYYDTEPLDYIPSPKLPYYGMESPKSDSSSSPGIRTPGLNRTYNASQSPVIKGPFYGMESPESDSPSPVIKGPSYRGRLTRADRTYDVSPSSGSQGSSSQSRSPRADRTFNASPSPGSQGSSSPSQSARADGTYNVSPSEFEESYDSHRAMNRAQEFDSHQQAPFNKISTQGSDSISGSSGSFRQSAASRLDGTYNRSPSSHQSSSGSASSQFSRTTDRSLSPKMNQTFDRNMSSESGRSDDDSPLNTGFYQTDASQLNRTFDYGTSGMNRNFSESSSTQSDGTRDESILNKGFLNRTLDRNG